MSCVLFSSLRKARFPSFYSLLTLTAMLISVSDIGTTAIGTGRGGLLLALLVQCLAVAIVRYAGRYLNIRYDRLPELGNRGDRLKEGLLLRNN